MASRSPRMTRSNHGAETPVCPACGRRIEITWPARSLLCGCGAQVLPRPPAASGPGFLRHGTGVVGSGPTQRPTDRGPLPPRLNRG